MRLSRLSSFLLACLSLLLLPAGARADAVQVINLLTNDLAFNPRDGMLYASIPSRGPNGNSLVRINPATGAVSNPIFIGSEPNRLGLSEDGRTLYVGIDGAASVRRFDVDSLTAGPSFSLGGDFNYQYTASSIVVLPGTQDSVAVCRLGGSPAPLAIFDSGVQRPTANAQYVAPYLVAASPSPGRLYGFSGYYDGVTRIQVNSQGASPIDTLPSPSGFQPGFGGWAAGQIFYSNGQVYNSESGVLVGTYSQDLQSTAVIPDLAAGRVYFLSGGQYGQPVVIHVYDAASYVPLGDIAVPDASGEVGRFVRCGPGKLAFRTASGQVLLVSSALIADPLPPVSVSASVSAAGPSIGAGADLTYTATVTNNGSNRADGVVLTATIPDPAILLFANAAPNAGYVGGNVVIAQLGSLDPGATAQVSILVRPLKAGPLTTNVNVTTSQANLDLNSKATVTTAVTPGLGVDLTGKLDPLRITGKTSKQHLQGTLTVQNLGKGSVHAATATLYTSFDPTFQPQTSQKLASIKIGAVAGLATRSIRINIPLAGVNQYLAVVIDDGPGVTDINSQDNTFVLPVPSR